MIAIADVAQLRAHLGRELAVSGWVTVTQERITRFADVTEDHQWIHIDAERAARDSPYGTTIAHGFLTLSLISALVRDAIAVGGQSRTINYGFNKVRFVSPVPAGARIRARVTPFSIEPIEPGVTHVAWNIVVERDGGDKPCLVAEWLVRYYEAS
jgi:acyl dehydratase